MMRKTRFLLVCLTLNCLCLAQSQNKELSENEKETIIAELRNQIRQHYVIEDMANDLDRKLQQHQDSTRYREVKSPDTLAKYLTEDLRRWSSDLHFLIFYVKPLPPGALPPGNIAVGAPFAKVRMLDGNVAYVHNINGRLSHPKEEISRVLSKASSANAVIIDLRSCTGGSRESVRFLVSHFFARAFHFVTYHQRQKKPKKVQTLKKVPGKRLSEIPVYILTGKNTASGCEALAYHLKHQERATIVGQTTMGAAHAVKTYDLAHNFRMLLPHIRTIDPVTGTDWEGTGVVPNIAVPENQAFDAAYQRARQND